MLQHMHGMEIMGLHYLFYQEEYLFIVCSALYIYICCILFVLMSKYYKATNINVQRDISFSVNLSILLPSSCIDMYAKKPSQQSLGLQGVLKLLAAFQVQIYTYIYEPSNFVQRPLVAHYNSMELDSAPIKMSCQLMFNKRPASYPFNNYLAHFCYIQWLCIKEYPPFLIHCMY